jgi:hypothetical protein
MPNTLKISPLLAVLLLTACTTMPNGPSALVLPGTGKSFDLFRADDFECKQFAHSQLEGTTPENAQVESGAKSALFGTLLGAVAGAAINGRQGAAVGAGTGLVFGGLSGAGAANRSGHTVQQRYDYAYQQCMYAKGHRVPVAGGGFTSDSRQPTAAYAQPAVQPVQTSVQPPPPPPGAPPAPPPR